MSKKILIPIICIVILIVILFFLRGDEDTWLCQNGVWVKHGNPTAAQPTQPCGHQTQPVDKSDLIQVTQPQSNATINNPLIIEGQARGLWFFEASFPVKLVDSQGKILAQGVAQAQSDWMTENFVPFKATLEFNVSDTQPGNLFLIKDNPSGLPENDDSLTIPVILQPSGKIKIKVFFNNTRLNPDYACEKVFAVEHEILKTTAVARAALEELLAGPNEIDQIDGFTTSLNAGIKIQKLTIENGVVKVDFDETLEKQVGGSCRVAAIRHQITETLKQFPTVSEVIISIDDRTEDILQP